MCHDARAFLEQVDDGDCLEQLDMKGITTIGFTSFERFRCQGPSMSVRRSEDGWFKISAKIVPQPVGAV